MLLQRHGRNNFWFKYVSTRSVGMVLRAKHDPVCMVGRRGRGGRTAYTPANLACLMDNTQCSTVMYEGLI